MGRNKKYTYEFKAKVTPFEIYNETLFKEKFVA